MPLTKIDPADFVFSNDAISTSCWRDQNGNPVDAPSFSTSFISKPSVWGGTQIRQAYIGNPANTQFSYISGINKDGTNIQQFLYGAVLNILYGDKNAVVDWGSGAEDNFQIISISKNCLRSSLDPYSLRIGNLTTNAKQAPPMILNCGRAYIIAQADSLTPFSYGISTGSPRGLFLPDVGLFVYNFGVSGFGSEFLLCNLNPTPTNHVFIRARNTQYNYSTNPSFISGSSGKIIHRDWYDNPQTYITTVGLYNDNNELMATAKLPRPYNKNFQNELLIQVGLNF